MSAQTAKRGTSVILLGARAIPAEPVEQRARRVTIFMVISALPDSIIQPVLSAMAN
jgi:hypothetical protein